MGGIWKEKLWFCYAVRAIYFHVAGMASTQLLPYKKKLLQINSVLLTDLISTLKHLYTDGRGLIGWPFPHPEEPTEGSEKDENDAPYNVTLLLIFHLSPTCKY